MDNPEYLKQYEQRLEQALLQQCTQKGLLNGQLLDSPDISEYWLTVAKDYMSDAVPQIADYPLCALGWAMYLGMAIAKFWDTDWEKYSKAENIYCQLRDDRGFDYLDEVVRGKVLNLEGQEFDRMERVVQDCSQTVLSLIRKEQIEPATPLAFQVYMASINTLYRIGAAIILRSLGYNFVKMN